MAISRGTFRTPALDVLRGNHGPRRAGKMQKVLTAMVKSYLPKRPALDPCPIEAVVAMIGGKWKARILYLLWFEDFAFAELLRQLSGVSQQVLSTQLQAMERDGLVRRRQAGESERHAGRYALTAKGRELVALIMPVADWSVRQLRRDGLEWSPPAVAEGPRHQIQGSAADGSVSGSIAVGLQTQSRH
jgi:DNA-binding HxlR family transcriptional regulator